MNKKTTRIGEDLQVISQENFTNLDRSQNDTTLNLFVDVLLNVPVSKLYTYHWPFLDAQPRRGQRVVVQFGHRQLVAVVFNVWPLEQSPTFMTLDIQQVLDDGLYLNEVWFQLIDFCASYYHYPKGMAALESLPKALRVLSANNQEPVMVKKSLNSVLNHESTKEQIRKIKVPIDKDECGIVPQSQSMGHTLTAEQSEVLSSLLGRQGFNVFVLWGVTGSGKTEVYLQYLEAMLKGGGQALILLPEINLTPAAFALYQNYFKIRSVVLLHSNLSELERTKNWFKVVSGQAEIIIATRLGVLTPIPFLKVIIVDEEHDPSYRQQDGMKYNARDIAVLTAKYQNVPIVLGSATPSIETWKHCQDDDYHLLIMKKRAVLGASLPKVRCVDTRNCQITHGLAAPVIDALRVCLANGQQALVFLNRRGYAPQLGCQHCGWVASCSACSVSLVWHKQERTLRCHYCGACQPLSGFCPECSNQDLKSFGRGTQRIEEQLQSLFPQARILRIDSDSTRKKGELEVLLNSVNLGHADILIGTQMITKGHDFANIRLVIALNSDAALVSHAYKAPERLFSQLMQVSGRAGRRAGEATMWVQTRYPDHPLLKALERQDYEQFANFEMLARKQARMPPFSFQALLRADHKKFSECFEFLAWAKQVALELKVQGIHLCDPVPLAVLRVAQIERAHMLIESNSRRVLHQFLDHWLELLEVKKTPVRWYLEVDPSEL